MSRTKGARSFCLRVKNPRVLWLGLLLVTGCAAGPQHYPLPVAPSTTAPAMAQINEALQTAAQHASGTALNYRVGPEDVLQITLFNVPENEGGVTPRQTEVRVNHEGTITLPLLGDIPAAGLTTTELEQALRERYDRYLHNPEVGVYVKDFHGQPVSVVGAVRKPGVVQLTGPKTLIDLLAMAGGISDQAGGQVHLYRQDADGRRSYVIDLFALASNPDIVNMPVQAGDLINIPLAGMFFVDGAVMRRGSFPLSRPYTLTQALAMAGGTNYNLADYSNIMIFRRRDALEAERIAFNLNNIFDGTVADPPIEPEDVVFVPISTGKYIVDRFLGRIGLPGVPTPLVY